MQGNVRLKHLVPNAITLASATMGLLVMFESAAGHFERAVWLVFAAGMCDLADGRIARLIDAGSAFGGELDSLADAIAFGAAPTVMVYHAVLYRLGPLGAVVAAAYLLLGILRLARFNLDKTKRATFYGIPIPVAAGYMVSFVLMRDQFAPSFIALGVLAVAGFMISMVKVPNFKDRERSLPMFLLPVPILLFAAFLIAPGAFTWHLWNGVNCLLVLMNYRMFARRPDLRAVSASPSDRAA